MIVEYDILQHIDKILLERENSERIEKHHGIVNHRLKKSNLHWILEELGYGDHKIVGGNFFSTPNPFHVHTDNGKDNDPDFNILIPLNQQQDFTTVIYDQTYSGYASHFWVGSLYKYFPSPAYNEPKRDYIGVNNLISDSFNINFYVKYLTHLPYETLQGLSIQQSHTWKIGQVYKFECNRLHSSSNFKGTKEGLTLLVKRPS